MRASRPRTSQPGRGGLRGPTDAPLFPGEVLPARPHTQPQPLSVRSTGVVPSRELVRDRVPEPCGTALADHPSAAVLEYGCPCSGFHIDDDVFVSAVARQREALCSRCRELGNEPRCPVVQLVTTDFRRRGFPGIEIRQHAECRRGVGPRQHERDVSAKDGAACRSVLGHCQAYKLGCVHPSTDGHEDFTPGTGLRNPVGGHRVNSARGDHPVIGSTALMPFQPITDHQFGPLAQPAEGHPGTSGNVRVNLNGRHIVLTDHM